MLKTPAVTSSRQLTRMVTALIALLSLLAIGRSTLGGSSGSGALPAARQDALQQRSKALVEALSHGRYASATESFDPTLRARISPARLEGAWNSLVAKYGAFMRPVVGATERDNRLRVVLVQCQFTKATVEAKIAFDEQDQIAGLFFRPLP